MASKLHATAFRQQIQRRFAVPLGRGTKLADCPGTAVTPACFWVSQGYTFVNCLLLCPKDIPPTGCCVPGSKGKIGDSAKSRCKVAKGGLKKCRCLIRCCRGPQTSDWVFGSTTKYGNECSDCESHREASSIATFCPTVLEIYLSTV